MPEQINFVAFPEGVYPARFSDRIRACIAEIDEALTPEERAQCVAATTYQIGPYRATLTLPPITTQTGEVGLQVSFEHTDLRRLAVVLEKAQSYLTNNLEGGGGRTGI